jgi:hypothetical protein
MSKINPGKYTAIAREWKLGETDNTHTPFIGVQFELLDESVAGVTMNWSGWLSDAAIDRTLESLRACGWRGKDISDLTGIGDRRVTVTVDNEEYKGKTFPRIKFVNMLGGGLKVGTALAPDKMRELVATSKIKAASLPVHPIDADAPKAKKNDVADQGDDGIPF